jgi:hypothetical protein
LKTAKGFAPTERPDWWEKNRQAPCASRKDAPPGWFALRRGSVGFRFQNLACDDQIIAAPPSPILARSANGGHEVSSLITRKTDTSIPAALTASAVAEFGMNAQPVTMVDLARKNSREKPTTQN